VVTLYQVACQTTIQKDQVMWNDTPPRHSVSFRDPVPNNIICLAGGEEMLRVGPDGFWVRGVKVEQDEKEAQAVYNAFKQWMAWASLEGQY
jgi:hypothetical protein